MSKEAQKIDLPKTLPIFPLTGALLLPHSQLPLNIFEPRYIKMIDDAFREQRMIGMVQLKGTEQDSPLYEIGCAGRIVTFEEAEDDRYLISLLGTCRFRIEAEIESAKDYRRAQVNWEEFADDLNETKCFGYKRDDFFQTLQTYLSRQGLEMNWDVLHEAPDEKLISALSMICPLEPAEKQALLEAPDCRSRGQLLQTMLEFDVHKKYV